MAWELLFTSDIGLLSLFTIVFILVMGAYLYRFARRHIRLTDGIEQTGLAMIYVT